MYDAHPSDVQPVQVYRAELVNDFIVRAAGLDPSRHSDTELLPPPPTPLFNQEPEELVDMALARLQGADLRPVEWNGLLYRRMGVPVLIKDFAFILPDNSIEYASKILTDMGLPRAQKSCSLSWTEGDFHTRGVFHRVTRETSPVAVQHIVLYPASFAEISVHSLLVTSAPSILGVDSPRTPNYLVPQPSAIYASLVRMMQRYPRQCSTRCRLNSDLSQLVGYDLLCLEDDFIDPHDEEQWQKLGMDRRIEQAVCELRGWIWEPGEEWIVDALEAAVRGSAEIDFLPCVHSTAIMSPNVRCIEIPNGLSHFRVMTSYCRACAYIIMTPPPRVARSHACS
ncbi:uncharacterized protein LAESUDRAFT_476330 [Laetiporus sulphureus 93-53]|uniref:Uncharacterized protein n=1 Tax=Laetiporus sulphureus 93-53 TaxID=1314785 RepID=A0A165GDK2_9APHY|nr:uncharacterized protein LAESUDRAFT_476330 [Laetiporus sulphureus 93-53]KZT10199.1 hypothetical protein LAESUDRAFT_476330 [Laetiporus sulphureus 93-53]